MVRVLVLGLELQGQGDRLVPVEDELVQVEEQVDLDPPLETLGSLVVVGCVEGFWMMMDGEVFQWEDD